MLVKKGFDDPRSNVFWKIIEIAKYHKPSCIVLENVKNLTSHDNGDTLDTIISSLIKIGYLVKYQILNTSAITNIPHHRERIYIVCIKNQPNNLKLQKIYDEFNFDFCSQIKKTIPDMLDNNIASKYYYHTNSKIHKIVQNVVTNSNTIHQFRRIYVRENKNNECPTLTANMGTGGHNVPLVFDKIGPRKLTPRECFNFQGFPSTYVINNLNLSDAKLYKLAGNAVSVPVVKLIVNKLIKNLYMNIIIDDDVDTFDKLILEYQIYIKSGEKFISKLKTKLTEIKAITVKSINCIN